MKKVIHYCWFGRGELPELAIKCIESWKKYLPDYEIIQWNEDNFNVNENVYISEAYKQKKYAFVSDYARLKIIYENGGIYFDTDVELINNIDLKYLEKGFFALEDKNLINTGLGFCAEKGNELVKLMLNDYDNIHFVDKNGETDLTSCPIRNSNSLLSRGIDISNEQINNMYILNKSFCNPLDYKTGLLKLKPNTFSIHHGAASWLNKEQRKFMEKRHYYIKKYGVFLGYGFYYIYKIYCIIFSKKINCGGKI